MQPSFDETGGELCLPIRMVVERADVGRTDHHERRVAGERLVEADAVQLLAQRSWAHRGCEVRPAVDARLEPFHVVHHDEVGQVDAAQCDGQRRVQHLRGQAPRGIHASLRPAGKHDLLDGALVAHWHVNGRPPIPRRPERTEIARVLGGRDERELERRRIHLARRSMAGRVEPRFALAQGDDGHRPFMHPVGADQRSDRAIGKLAVQPSGQAGRVGHREHLGEHGAGVPVDVAEPALPIPPPRAPWHAGDDDRGRLAARRRTDEHECVFLRVVPVHSGGQPRALGHGHVDLQREAATR